MAPKLRMLWLQGITCNGNTHSFLNHPRLEQLLSHFDIMHHPLLPSSMTLEAVAACRETCDVLIVEGAYRSDFERASVTMQRLLEHYASSASHIIAAGSCASFGGMFRATDPEHVSGLLFDGETAGGVLQKEAEKLVNLPGCPLHPEWLAFVLQMIVAGRPIMKDAYFRPLELYGYLVHHGCLRNEYFEWKVDAERFGMKEGCLFYEQGCRGPMTHASCNKIMWNDSSSKTRSGQPCFGCTEPDFPRRNLFETKKNMSIPDEVPVGVPKRSYLTVTGIAKTFRIERLHKRLFDDHQSTD